MTYWRGKRAVVTGGSAGLGRAIARSLAKEGVRVAIVARGQEQLAAAAEELRTIGGEVLPVTCDVTLQADVDRLAETVHTSWGGIDLLCHCAGRSMRGTALGTSPDEYRSVWETNFLAAVRCAQSFADSLKASNGHLVLVGSLASKVAAGYLGAYPASKFPLAAFAQQLRIENTPQGFHTLLVCPGPIARPDDRGDNPRYSGQGGVLPDAAHRPGGGAKTRAIDPNELAAKILRACESRRAELIVPASARLLFIASQVSPRWGDWLLRKLTSG
ncbi:MAG TPA: SDR family NAD(P)-dependent oxidoreductase [Lacipirellulaceae bacterium]|jgi:short-subunit dehydrogenase|nr:SDR family NAD(P)-dependent oxidoreductase [Lacipirellulaceae bacterium]